MKKASDRIPFFRFYPADFMAGVRGMSALEVGVYTMLLCRIYEENGPVENHTLRLATYCGMRVPTFERTLEKLIALGKLTLVDGRLSNPRAEAEIAKRADDLKNSSKAGKASAEIRLEKQRDTATGVERPFNHTDTDTEKKEGGGGSARGAELPPEPPPAPPQEAPQLDPDPTDRELILAAIGVDPVSGLTGHGSRMLGKPADMAFAARWLALPGLTIDRICDEIRSVMAGKRDGPPSSFEYFDKPMQRLSGALTAPPLDPIAPAATRGPTNAGIAFDHAIQRLADRLDAGTAHIDRSNRDPLAQLARRHAAEGEAGADDARILPARVITG